MSEPELRSSAHIAPISASGARDQDTSRHAGMKRKRTINALAACNSCRKRKSRCDGGRPSCDACKRHGRVCEYDVEPGFRKRESERRKLDDLRAEHRDLQDVMRQIRDGNPEQVEAILRRLRDGQIDGIEAMLSARAKASESKDDSPAGSVEDAEMQSWGSNSNPDVPPLEITPKRRFTKHGSQSAHIDILKRHIFKITLDAYHKSAGDLFHTYTPEQANSLLDAVFVPDQEVPAGGALTQLCSIAAVGSMYCQESLPEKATEQLYSIARNNLHDLIGVDILSAVKVTLMLALCNMVYKSVVAMSYLNLGLIMSRKSDFHPSQKPTGVGASQWTDHKRVWRTLILCNGWMVSTTGLAAKICWAESHEILQILSHEPDMALRDVIQLEIAKISTLKANTLSILGGTERIEPTLFSEIRSALQQWCENLPQIMSLNSLIDDKVADAADRLKVLYAHLIYLGSLMLLARCLARRWLDQSAAKEELSTKQALESVDEGFVAAQQSARVLSLLQAEGMVQNSWLCTYESYNATLMMMFKFCQGLLLQGTDHDEMETLLDLSQRSLDCLRYCAAEDHTASVLYSHLQPHIAVVQAEQERIKTTKPTAPKQHRPHHPFYIPSGNTGLHHTAFAILDLFSEYSESLPQINGSVTAQRTKSVLEETDAEKGEQDWELATPPAENPSRSWVMGDSKPRRQPRVLFPFSSILEPQMANASSVQPSDWVEQEIGGRGAESVASRLSGAR